MGLSLAVKAPILRRIQMLVKPTEFSR